MKLVICKPGSYNDKNMNPRERKFFNISRLRDRNMSILMYFLNGIDRNISRRAHKIFLSSRTRHRILLVKSVVHKSSRKNYLQSVLYTHKITFNITRDEGIKTSDFE